LIYISPFHQKCHLHLVLTPRLLLLYSSLPFLLVSFCCCSCCVCLLVCLFALDTLPCQTSLHWLFKVLNVKNVFPLLYSSLQFCLFILLLFCLFVSLFALDTLHYQTSLHWLSKVLNVKNVFPLLYISLPFLSVFAPNPLLHQNLTSPIDY